MHSYDPSGRGRVVAFLAIGSVLLVWLIHLGLDVIELQPPWWLGAPSVAGLCSGLYWSFDRFVWRLGLLRRLGLLTVPDLNGEWAGRIKSSFGQGGTVLPVSVVILQRWSKMVISLETMNSRSRSVVASLRVDDLPYPELVYVFVNEPKATARDSMNMHYGTTTLELKGSCLHGDYYTGRGRGTVGSIKVTRVEDYSNAGRL